MISSKFIAITLVLAAVFAVGIGGIARQSTFAQDAGNITGSVVVADEKNQVTILGQQGPPGERGLDGAPGATGATGPAGADGKDGIVSFRCFDLNNVQINCPFVSVPITQPPVVVEPPVVVANETGNVTEPTVPAVNETGNVTTPAINETTGGIPEPTGNVTGGLNQNGTIVLGGEVPAVNETTTTTTTNTTVTTAPDGTTTTNSTSETIPTAFSHLAELFGIHI